jgi:transcriptional regulator with XRE-family HTH domain
MPFNIGLLREIRVKSGAGRSEFAELLGISKDYLYRFESGLREPGVGFIERLARHSGMPIGAFFQEEWEDGGLPEIPGIPSDIKNLTELIRSINRERSLRKTMGKRILELERLTEHFMPVNELHVKQAGILRRELPKPERAKKIAALARETARGGELRFDEISAILNLNRSALKHLLESEKTGYTCKMADGKTVTASTPGEAGMRFLCFDCEARASEDCRGYGENSYPENIFVLIALFEANGVYSRIEQSELLRESYGIEFSPHQISELLSRKKHGKPVPEDVENIDIRGR